MGRLLDVLLANMDQAHSQAQVAAALGVGAARSTKGSSQQQPQHSRRLMLYSGHDSTVMPLLTGEQGCMCGCSAPYKGPHYAAMLCLLSCQFRRVDMIRDS